MKILEITVGHRSDDTRIYHKYVKSLVTSGFEVGYIAPNPNLENDSKLSVFPVKSNRRLVFRLLEVLRKIREIKNFAPAIIHLHDPELLLITPLLRFVGFEVVYDMHENFYRELDDKPISRASKISQKFVWKILEKFVLRHLMVVFAEQSYARDFQFVKKQLVVQNFPSAISYNRRSPPSPTPHPRPRFVYLGTISEDRGALKMIEALELAFGKFDFELHYIGDITDPYVAGYLHKKFKESSNLIFHGYQSMHNAWKICSDCDVGLAILDPKANYIESYPTKLFEYLICGLPIITSNFPLYRNLVEGYNIGRCVNPNDINNIIESVKEIVGESEYFSVGSHVDKFPFAQFTWESEFLGFHDYLRNR